MAPQRFPGDTQGDRADERSDRGLTMESTYNRYRLVDALMDEGYKVLLANPSAMKMNEMMRNPGRNSLSLYELSPCR